MKKVFGLLVVLVTSFFFASCSNDNDDAVLNDTFLKTYEDIAWTNDGVEIYISFHDNGKFMTMYEDEDLGSGERCKFFIDGYNPQFEDGHGAETWISITKNTSDQLMWEYGVINNGDGTTSPRLIEATVSNNRFSIQDNKGYSEDFFKTNEAMPCT